MRVLFDIGHPGHVHLFKNVAHNLKRGGDEVLFTVRDKEHEIDLLKSEGCPTSEWDGIIHQEQEKYGDLFIITSGSCSSV